MSLLRMKPTRRKSFASNSLTTIHRVYLPSRLRLEINDLKYRLYNTQRDLKLSRGQTSTALSKISRLEKTALEHNSAILTALRHRDGELAQQNAQLRASTRVMKVERLKQEFALKEKELKKEAGEKETEVKRLRANIENWKSQSGKKDEKIKDLRDKRKEIEDFLQEFAVEVGDPEVFWTEFKEFMEADKKHWKGDWEEFTEL